MENEGHFDLLKFGNFSLKDIFNYLSLPIVSSKELIVHETYQLYIFIFSSIVSRKFNTLEGYIPCFIIDL